MQKIVIFMIALTSLSFLIDAAGLNSCQSLIAAL